MHTQQTELKASCLEERGLEVGVEITGDNFLKVPKKTRTFNSLFEP